MSQVGCDDHHAPTRVSGRAYRLPGRVINSIARGT
jgi:hypothetical protein